MGQGTDTFYRWLEVESSGEGSYVIVLFIHASVEGLSAKIPDLYTIKYIFQDPHQPGHIT